jgi:hypothetical protein
MQPINLQITFADGSTAVVSTTAADFIAFEAHFDRSIAILSTDARLTYMFYLAYSAQLRTGATEKTFDEWVTNVTMIGEPENPKESKA